MHQIYSKPVTLGTQLTRSPFLSSATTCLVNTTAPLFPEVISAMQRSTNLSCPLNHFSDVVGFCDESFCTSKEMFEKCWRYVCLTFIFGFIPLMMLAPPLMMLAPPLASLVKFREKQNGEKLLFWKVGHHCKSLLTISVSHILIGCSDNPVIGVCAKYDCCVLQPIHIKILLCLQLPIYSTGVLKVRSSIAVAAAPAAESTFRPGSNLAAQNNLRKSRLINITSCLYKLDFFI